MSPIGSICVFYRVTASGKVFVYDAAARTSNAPPFAPRVASNYHVRTK